MWLRRSKLYYDYVETKVMRYNLQLLESNSEISKSILEAMQQHLSRALRRVPSLVSPDIKDIVATALRAEPEYQSLISGQLRLEMGIAETGNVDIIIDKLVNTLEITYNPVVYRGKSLSGGFTLTMMKSDDLGGVIADEAAFVTDGLRGYSLPWLEWLLLRGNNTIVNNYSVRFGANNKSRTGSAIMVSSSSGWRVPPQFVGTAQSNWTTRAISACEDSIVKTIEQAVIGVI